MTLPDIPEPLERLELDAAELVQSHPPKWQDANKRVVQEVALPAGSVHSGTIHYSRWPAFGLPASIPAAQAHVEGREGYFDYPCIAPGQGRIWHVNFADPHLFAFYGGALFAQDEVQVTEHPALASLYEHLSSGRAKALTVEGGRPTPVLVAGVERRCRVDTGGLYGNAFSRARAEAVRRATTRIEPPTVSSILAMAAPAHGSGPYTAVQVRLILLTAWSGFAAARAESERLDGARAVAVHTGFWGCGAFGGNRTVMSALQIVAARLAGVELVFFTGSAPGIEDFERGQEVAGQVAPAGAGMDEVVEAMTGRGFRWGVGDGN